ncbi:MAG: PhzF family phenazine biosynthesis protein [Pseudomonadota bacterium]
MKSRRFIQCDVFSSVPTRGNGLAVVVDGDGLSDEVMQTFAAWTNLAETTFLMTPSDPAADYKVRIFTPGREMLFAGHPTLGSCASWLHCGGQPKQSGVVRQECGVGIVDIDISGTVPSFLAPDTLVEPMSGESLAAIASAAGISDSQIVRTAQLTNGPVWQALELASAADVLAIDAAQIRYPDFRGIGFIGAHPPGSECDYEVRMLGSSSGMLEDPITGSLNAALGCWMRDLGLWRGEKKIAQGTSIGRYGRVATRCSDSEVWIGGESHVLIEGSVKL